MNHFIGPKIVCNILDEVRRVTDHDVKAESRHELQMFMHSWIFKVMQQDLRNNEESKNHE